MSSSMFDFIGFRARRGWLSLQIIFLVVAIVMALPAGRRKREISEKELA